MAGSGSPLRGLATVPVAQMLNFAGPDFGREETADVFGILPQTVKTRLFRARGLLRAEMEKHIGAVLEDAFPFEGRRCERLTEAVLARLDLA
jgi:hypothetical protein